MSTDRSASGPGGPEDRTPPKQVFISHASADDALVRNLQQALDLQGRSTWIDSRELRGGDRLWPEIRAAIEQASAFLVLISPAGLQSKWIGKELTHALAVQRQRGKDRYPVIPLLLDGTKPGLFETLLGEEPIYIPITSSPDGIAEALPKLRAALGLALSADTGEVPQPAARPLEDLVLQLSDLGFHEHEDGVGRAIMRASARAHLVCEPASPDRDRVHCNQDWRLIAPIGPIEQEEIRWYLEQYAIWPGTPFRTRAARVEQGLIDRGQALYRAALPPAHADNVLRAWERIDDKAGRRFSVHVDASVLAGSGEDARLAAQEAATSLLGLPWELLHDGQRFLFQGARPTRVRRRLPGTRGYEAPLLDPPIRILMVSPRPEDDTCGYLDHRLSAIPLVDATERLGGLVEVTILHPPTLPALRDALDEAREQGRPFHVLHFDGHGLYDRRLGLGGLCFEDPDSLARLEQRPHRTHSTDELRPLLADHRIPLVVLEACQSAKAEQATESVATALLKVGVASVIAMSHSVLVETARRFVEPFYRALADGRRVGDAMLAGQRALHDEDGRGRIFGASELRLKDWFVPVLYQERADPRLFTKTPARETEEQQQKDLQARLGQLPPPPETGFIGRSHELLALERLFRGERWALIRGQGGEGKTALAIELARWQVRSGQTRRCAFAAVEGHSTPDAVLYALGQQLVRGFPVPGEDNREQAIQQIERVLAEQATILILDNLEALLPARFAASDAGSDPNRLPRWSVGASGDPNQPSCAELRADDDAATLAAILALAARLMAAGRTRLLLTSREPLPAPFAAVRNRRELHRLAMEDAVRLIEQSLAPGPPTFSRPDPGRLQDGGPSSPGDAQREETEALVEAVQGHARTLALLAPSLQARGVEATRASLVILMEEMQRRWPDDRERSLYASVELSLRRLTPAQRQRARVLGVFHGGVDLDLLAHMMEWDPAEVQDLARALVETGLATPGPYNHLALTPALCPWLHRGLDPDEEAVLADRWQGAMEQYVRELVQQYQQKAKMAATLTLLGLDDLLALLERVAAGGDPAATIDLATSLHRMFQNLGRPRLLQQVARARDAAAAALGTDWSHTAFEAQRTRIQEQLAGGQLRVALDGAEALLRRARSAGAAAYRNADYDLAMACALLGSVLKGAGVAGQAMAPLDEAHKRFEAVAQEKPGRGAERMVSVCLAERGDCLRDLGRLDEAARAYEEAFQCAERLGYERQVAIGKGNLGTVRLYQRRYQEALDAFADARGRFERLGEPCSVAVSWHRTGMAYQDAGRADEAEAAYRQALVIAVRLGDSAGQARTLLELGNLYGDLLDRPEEAVAFYRQAADRYVEIGDTAGEGVARSNLAATLRWLGRLDKTRRELYRAIECKASLGHAAEPWKTWDILAGIELDAGNPPDAAQARARGVATYLAYRRDGGENHSGSGRLALALSEPLLAGDKGAATDRLSRRAADPELPEGLRPFIAACEAIVQGSRDPALAEAPGLSYSMSAELLHLIERLER